MTSDTKNIVWLASYPKSGNTWFRLLLANALRDQDCPVGINELQDYPIASNRLLIDTYCGIETSDLSNESIETLRTLAYQTMARQVNQNIFFKVHDSYAISSAGEPLFPSEVSKGVIYLVRNPLDVAVSFAHHANSSIGAAIRKMNNSNYAFCNDAEKLPNQLRQHLGTWTEHVLSWTKQAHIPLLLIRYEDLLMNTFKTFRQALLFLGLSIPDEEIQNAIDLCAFAKLQEQEKKFGFREKALNAKNFFRYGKSGAWQEVMTHSQIKAIQLHHGELMKQLKYKIT